MTTKLTSNPWISCPKPNPQARLRLFCFPCAGGTISAYSQWSNYLPKDVEVHLVQLPGRGYRLEEPPFTRFFPLVQTLTSILRPYLNIPFAFFGHSMGATLAFEITRQLRRENHPSPVHLFGCCCPAPEKPILKPFIHQLPETEFLAELHHRYNAIPQAILQNAQLTQLFLPSLRADFTMIETYVYAYEKPLNCPITVFGGLQDKAICLDSLEAWGYETYSPFTLRMFSGDHFFLHHPQSPFLQFFSQELYQLLPVTAVL